MMLKKLLLVFVGMMFYGEGTVFAAQELFYRSLVTVPPQPYFSYFLSSLDSLDASLPSSLRSTHTVSLQDHFVDWTTLNYFSSEDQKIDFTPQDDFVFKPSLLEDRRGKKFRAQIYQDLLSIPIDNELTVKRLSFLNADFRTSLFQYLYEEDFVKKTLSFNQMKLFSLMSFTGEGGLIDLFIKSRFYNKEMDISPVLDGPYIPNPHKFLVIEARGLNISPALFPNIYTRDVTGKLQLVYSFAMSDKIKIVQNGYARYVTDEGPFAQDPKNYFYTAALGVYGESHTDLVISRESYLQFFSSSESLQNLREGNLIIITTNPSDKKASS